MRFTALCSCLFSNFTNKIDERQCFVIWEFSNTYVQQKQVTDSPTDLPAPLSSASVTAGLLPPSSCASHLDSEICSCNFSGESSPFLAWSWFLEEQRGNRWILRILLFSELSLQHPPQTHTNRGGTREMVISFMYWEGRKPAHYMGSEDNLQESLSF